MSITIVTFTGGSSASSSFLPLETKAGDAYSSVDATFEPMTTRMLAGSGTENSFLPLITLASEDKIGSASTSFEPLITSADSGLPAPVSSSAMFHPLTTNGVMMTGILGTVASAFKPLDTLGGVGDYGEGEPVFQPMVGMGMSFPILDSTMFATLPAVTLVATSIAGTLNGVNATLPAVTIEPSFVGGQMTGELGSVTAAITATIPNIGRLDEPVPAITFTGTGRASTTSALIKEIPAITGSAFAGHQLATVLPLPVTGAATSIAGTVSNANMVIPAVEMVAGTATKGNVITLNVTLPVVGILIPARLNATLPAVTLRATAVSSAVATFIAYAMNIDQDPTLDVKQQPGSAVTKYTNYPFMEIVRFGNENYGISADGIFLLSGETDDGTVIPWQFDTLLSEMGSPKQKNVSSAYAGGRIEGGVTYNLTVKESDIDTYTFVTPRGQDAQNYRQVFGKGPRTRYIGIGMQDAEGRDFELDTLNLTVNDMKRFI